MGVWQFSTIAILWPPSIAGGIIVLLSSFTALEPRALRCALEVSNVVQNIRTLRKKVRMHVDA